MHPNAIAVSTEHSRRARFQFVVANQYKLTDHRGERRVVAARSMRDPAFDDHVGSNVGRIVTKVVRLTHEVRVIAMVGVSH